MPQFGCEKTTVLSEERRRVWLARINRAGITDPDKHRVCSRHFLSVIECKTRHVDVEMSCSCFSNSDPMDSDNDYTIVGGKRLKRKYRGTTKDVNVVIDISDEEFQRLLSSTVMVLDFHRFGHSTSVKLLFEGDTLPDHVNVGYVIHPVRPYVPQAMPCHKCLKLGHVSAVCTGQMACLRCDGSHDISSCTVTEMKCLNCGGPPEANPKDCPKQKRR
ncbi:hypothetical protein HPB49_019951 [Dermacentor silvarum]|uniref:Uncharacterized protein n=1 Tax=Dermacentor silvarum TaxID=543639 RepID=A0ACB8D7M9_DERSI|nr:hypothetical protein HPB49_019951 [Dermacentor silvarum]